MKGPWPFPPLKVIPVCAGVLAVAALVFWFQSGPRKPLEFRSPGRDHAPGSEAGTGGNPVLAGKLTRGEGQPCSLPGNWPQFRGPSLDLVCRENLGLRRTWQPSEPREVWGIDVGEGYAGAAVFKGRVYLMDYDREKKQDALRCLSLADGGEIWRFTYPVSVKRNHGMSRTVPAANDQVVVAMGPKCHVTCLDVNSGQLLWGMDLVRQYGTVVPQWYAGQCPLLDKGTVVLAPAGLTNLLMALEERTGKILWESPNPRGWKMTHSSVAPMEVGGEKTYVYCADKGVVGVSAQDGKLLWETTDWKISIATVPSPLVLDGGRVFLSGGYNAGSLMLQVSREGDRFTAKTLFRIAPEIFGATQHTPIVYENHIYGVRPDGRFACLTLEGKPVWASDSSQQFGLGPFMMADGLILAMNDSGLLRLIEATSQKYTALAQAQVLKGRESWGPLAMAGNRLIARDLTRMVCLELPK
jgi:outer membrane protein assembly factor BamB